MLVIQKKSERKNRIVMKDLMIKNMVCPRCILAVENTLNDLYIPFEYVVLGRVRLKEEPGEYQKSLLEAGLGKLGFEVLEDKDIKRIEQIKNLFTELMQQEEIPSGFNISTYIREHIPEDYSRLSHLFSSIEGLTIEKYFIQLKIEKVKEWLFYEELNLSEMSWKLDYSSVQHLSSQFKKTTGMTPTEYRKIVKEGGMGWKDMG
jgi:YesN/AraC family two-component response regulator